MAYDDVARVKVAVYDFFSEVWELEYNLRGMKDRQAQYSENDSEPQTGIEPATFWWPVGRSNHWATKTQMVS